MQRQGFKEAVLTASVQGKSTHLQQTKKQIISINTDIIRFHVFVYALMSFFLSFSYTPAPRQSLDFELARQDIKMRYAR